MQLRKNKKTIFVLIFLSIIAGCLFLASKLGILQGIYPRGNKNDVSTELKNLGIEVAEGSGQTGEMELFSGDPREKAFWNQKEAACKKGGYNLAKFTGKNALFTSYSVENKIYKHSDGKEYPITVHIITVDDKVICVHGTIPDLIPGVLSIMNPFIKNK